MVIQTAVTLVRLNLSYHFLWETEIFHFSQIIPNPWVDLCTSPLFQWGDLHETIIGCHNRKHFIYGSTSVNGKGIIMYKNMPAFTFEGLEWHCFFF